jgi:NADH dehydrogenase [ubiquinone] 1 alpha subcomplex assembly factor 2
MASKQIGPVTRAWYKWKALRLPWRKRFLMGFDLQGNTYWEFRLTRGAESRERWRRIVQYPGSTHLSSVKVSPMWHQWLRHTREEPPTIEEQQGDVARQARMKTLAAEADARWEAKPRVMEAPQAAPAPLLQSANAGSLGQESKDVQADTGAKKIKDKVERKEDPWAKAKAKAPGETWQPSAWTPPAAKRR